MAGEMQGEMGDAGGGKVGGTQKLMGGGGYGGCEAFRRNRPQFR